MHGLLALDFLEEAEAAAEMIPLRTFRATAFQKLARYRAEKDPEYAARSLARALGEAEAVQDERNREQILLDTASTVAEVDGIRRGLSVLQCASFDDFIKTLGRWMPFLQRMDGTSPASAIRQTIAIAAWTRSDWREIDELLRREEALYGWHRR